jgi:hypothetical protein
VRPPKVVYGHVISAAPRAPHLSRNSAENRLRMCHNGAIVGSFGEYNILQFLDKKRCIQRENWAATAKIDVGLQQWVR